jgi:dihydroorotate dehydrogenase (fumarate)
MNLRTSYLGFDLANPLIIGASPISHDMEKVRRCVEAGASAVVMYSLFEEQLVREQRALTRALTEPNEAYAEAVTYLPDLEDVDLGPQRYLEQLRKLKRGLDVPVIASLNGVSEGGWIKFARLIQDAGADALELNTYNLEIDPNRSATQIEDVLLGLVTAVREAVKIPVAVKLSPFYTSLPHLTRRLVQAGVNGVVLFNRFYQPDIDPINLEVVRLNLSDSSELLLRLHWTAILYPTLRPASIAITGGVHTANDVIKCMMAGASTVQMVSSLLRGGPGHIRSVLNDLGAWMKEHEYESIEQMQGSMSLLRCPRPKDYVRDNYMQVLHSWTE